MNRAASLDVRRFLPGGGFGCMAEIACTECVRTVFACRVSLAGYGRLERLKLDIVQSQGGRCFSMGRTMAGLTLDTSLVTAAVDELAEKCRARGVCPAAYVFGSVAGEGRGDAGCRAAAGWQCGCQPRLCQLAGGYALVQISVTIGAPDAGIGLDMGAAIAVDAVARMAIVAVLGNVGIVRAGEYEWILRVEAVKNVGE